ncbi:MAG: DMT family transporter, partial [Chloroflexota bacterium]|nr:DMT family transporter [Chloroflexota bacterium]
VLAVVGLYFLSVTTKFTIRRGDLYILISAVAWAFHVQTIGRFTGRVGALRLSLIQFSVTSALSLLATLIMEDVDILTWSGALIPILYAGALSVGVGYTLQVVAQKDAPPTHAAIILSLESVFALVGGWLLLGEILTPRAILGCALMLVGMWVSQISRDTI